MVGRRSQQNPSISRLTSPLETIPSCYPGIRHTEFQPHSGRHLPAVHKLKRQVSLSTVVLSLRTRQRNEAILSEIHLNDIDPQKSSALQQRITALGGAARIYAKRAEVVVDEIVDALRPRGLHFAFLDPYKLEVLPFSIIRKLATVRKMDMLIHVSVFDLQRNLRRYVADGKVLNSFMPGWRGSVDVNRSDHGLRTELLNYWLGEIRKLGTSSRRRY